MRRLRAELPANVLLVLDAAYAEYVRRNDYEAGIELVATTHNTVMTRTFSKIYGLAGAAARLGLLPGGDRRRAEPHPRAVQRHRSPAIAAGVAAIADKAHVEAAVAHNEHWLPWLTAEIEKLGLEGDAERRQLRPDPLSATRRRKDADAADEFLKSRGIILRRVAGYGLPDCLRMTIGTEADNRAVVAALADFLGGRPA